MIFCVFSCNIIYIKHLIKQDIRMKVQKKIKFHPGVTSYFKELLVYNTYIKNPKIKRFKNIDLLFYKTLKHLEDMQWHKN